MNSQETMNLVRQLLTMIFAMLTAAVPALAASQNFTTLEAAIMAAIPALCTLGSIVWSVYAHWNQKKVPENATAVLLPTGPKPVGTTLDLTPMAGLAKVVGVILLALLLLPGIAYAQPKTAPITPLSVAQTLKKVGAPDLAYAIALATQAGTPQAKVRLACYQAIGNAFPAAPSGTTPPVAPYNVISNVEEIAELVDSLQPNSPVFVGCAGAAALAGQSLLTFVNAIITGAVSLAVIK